MKELRKDYRVHFPRKGAQRKWLEKVRTQVPLSELATLCSCSERTIRDWQREKFHMHYDSMLTICEHLDVLAPKIKMVEAYAHTSRAGKCGGTKVMQKYGRVPVSEINRKQRWKEWWNEIGTHQTTITQPRAIKIPRRSAQLAEFCGILLGDGGITPRQVTITLHRKDDREYARYVADICTKLFDVTPALCIRQKQNTITLILSRVALVAFLTQEIGLVAGNKTKQQVMIPEWIVQNPKYAIACARGLFDTDGSVFTHKYTSGGRSYAYKKLGFTSVSVPLRRAFKETITSLGIAARYAGNYDVRIDSIADVRSYFKLVGSRNPKHLKRLRK